MSHVTCQYIYIFFLQSDEAYRWRVCYQRALNVSRVTCHMSDVTCHMSHVNIYIYFFLQSGEAYRWRVCYQRGLPRLVLIRIHYIIPNNGILKTNSSIFPRSEGYITQYTP